QSSLNFEKHSENFLWTENHYEANHRRPNSSDGFDPIIGWPNGGHFGRKEKNGWRSQGRNGVENIICCGGYHDVGSCTRTSTFHCGKGQGLHENNVSDNETGKKEDKEIPKQFEAEDFPSLNPEYERTPNQNKSLVAGVWEYPLNPKSRSPRMLVIKKGSTKELQISGFPVVGSLHSQPVKNGTGTNFYKGLIPKPATATRKPTQWKSQVKENKSGNQFSHESAYSIGNFSPLKSTAKTFTVSQNSVKECNQSNVSSPVDKVGLPRLSKPTRIRTDRKSEFLKALKQDRVEEEHEDENHAGQEKELNLHMMQILLSYAFFIAAVLESSHPAETEHEKLLLKEMGWQEDSENDETCAPLTEDEMREFQVISEQLQKNGLRKNGILKDGLICDFKFSPWKNSAFKPALENEDSETSSSDTSDDDV
ncbi:GPBP1 protein, partial [Centropus unirufus]|nr:GPBP1 protein [Centropus unirufus]